MRGKRPRWRWLAALRALGSRVHVIVRRRGKRAPPPSPNDPGEPGSVRDDSLTNTLTGDEGVALAGDLEAYRKRAESIGNSFLREAQARRDGEWFVVGECEAAREKLISEAIEGERAR